MANDPMRILGIDAGSVAVSVVETDGDGVILREEYRFHNGHPRDALRTVIAEWSALEAGFSGWTSITASRSAAPYVLSPDLIADDHVAVMTAAKRLHGRIGSLLSIGGEKFGLFSWSGEGEYRSFKGNTSCAAGTGGFLDQQAERLGLSCAAELSALADSNVKEAPKIATRCAVFAKTDLTHAQQEGFSLDSIADGLSRGLAGNLLDVLLDGKPPAEPFIICGGVALNKAVVKHIADLTDTNPIVDDSAPLYGAMGASWALLEQEESLKENTRIRTDASEIIGAQSEVNLEKGFRYPPLTLKKSSYPDFSSYDSWEVPVEGRKGRYPVEVEIFEKLPTAGNATLGIDIGSTSTKAVLISEGGKVLLGLYTRTAGRPVEAMKGLLMALEVALEKHGPEIEVLACATTGSGRKLVGEILGADLILDEITAHARAAVHLDEEVDTIIEIGGQDAKFTTLKDGRVTGSVMNNVCAAGTGSFLEEQAARLGCVVTDYAERTEGISAPVTSDRCTVFMQRDLNHLMSEGYSVEEVLAAALHSVRENYLNKVAVRPRIGKKIFFQGATARIRTLVAAFEQALDKPILVSRFCSHTGALGAALQLIDDEIIPGKFRGVEIWKQEIPVRTEVCKLCKNACKLTLAEVEGETVAYGFLCGRDYGTDKYVAVAGEGAEPMDEQARLFRVQKPGGKGKPVVPYTLGLPAALYMAAELPFWEKFFALLGIPTITDCNVDPIESGKALTGAEFCAPMTALHGRVARLAEKADYVFIPFYLDEKGPDGDKHSYCYYSQFAPTLVKQLAPEGKVITPLVKTAYRDFRGKAAVYEALDKLPGTTPDLKKMEQAWKEAGEWFEEKRRELRRFHADRAREDDINVVLLGRPYVVADSKMNKDIPRLFSETGARVFDMEMLDAEGIDDLPWSYASQIMKHAERIADIEGTYPVLVSSFMCSPDSFVIPYVRELWEKRGKPYLILELDGHGSSVGYGTRVEAGVRSFRNHFYSKERKQPEDSKHVIPVFKQGSAADIRGKVMLIPNWDSDVMTLVTANLRREGVDARLLEETDETIRQGSRDSAGQCLPLSIIAREVAQYVGKHKLDPRNTVLWMLKSNWTCNIPLYPRHIMFLLKQQGGGLEHVQIHIDNIGLTATTPLSLVNTYYAYMFGGLLKRIACRIRPYEDSPGETDRVLSMARDRLSKVFMGRGEKMDAVKDIVARFEAIPMTHTQRPKVAIFGDVYVRDNEVMNQNLIRYIEAAGGEVVTMPYTRYAKMISNTHFKRLFKEKRYRAVAGWKVFLAALKLLERSYDRLFTPLAGAEEVFDDDPEAILAPYGVTLEHHGESMENLLKVHYLSNRHDDLTLFVQTSPSFCCAGLITEAMRNKIEEITGVPVVSITYDGTGGDKNDVVIPYLAFPRTKVREAVQEAPAG
ncbi:MAG: CoA activase [Spirochaetes bacterium]|nr:MAG: CoA activase [Spirochaetota bacterium]